MSLLDDKLMRGLALLRQGRPADAKRIFSEILQAQPGNFDALHLLGIIALQAREAEQGVALIRRALGINPHAAEAHSNLGRGLRALNRPAEALASYDRAIALNPGVAEMHNNRGAVLQALERPAEALASFDRAIALKPGDAVAHNNRGNALRDLGRPAEALASYDRAIALRPDLAEAHYNRGNALRNLQRDGEALASFDRAIALKPDNAAAHNNRGNVLQDMDRPDEALTSYDRAIALRPGYAKAHYNRGKALTELERPAEALESIDRAIALAPDSAKAHNNRGNALRVLERPDEALASYDRAVALDPGYAEAYSNRGNALQDLERIAEALASFDQAVALKPDHADAHWNRSLCLLLAGRLEEGWADYEWRKKFKAHSAIRSYVQPEWAGGGDLAGRTLFLHAEQGLGDTIQFCRYARLAEACGATVVLSVQDPLCRLLAGLSPTVRIIGYRDEPASFDCHAPLLSLPRAFGTTLGNVPAEVPYLAAEPDRVAAWRSRLGDDGFRIGICWQGKKTAVDIGRSYPLGELRDIAAIPGVRLISLQKNEGSEQLDDLPEGMTVETLGAGFDSGPHAFLDSAAVMQQLDLVITSDTAIAHLAGALGRRAWVALKRAPDWRWLLDGETSPWYPTLRLCRQKARGDWNSVFSEMAARLSAEGPGPAPRRG